MNHHGPSIGHGLGLDSPNKSQQARGVIGHAVVRPAREVKLPYLPDLVSPSLRSRVIVLNTHTHTHARGGAGETTENTDRLQCERSLKNKHAVGLKANTNFAASGSEAAAVHGGRSVGTDSIHSFITLE